MRRRIDILLASTVAGALIGGPSCGKGEASNVRCEEVDCGGGGSANARSGVINGTAAEPTVETGGLATSGGSGGTRTGPTGGVAITGGSSDLGCRPGVYEGAYTCEGLPGGPLTFELAANTRVDQSANDGCQEFCDPDLVIEEAESRLQGSWVVFAFEGTLVGGLDCQSGEFRAGLLNGRYGLPAADGVSMIGTTTVDAQGTYEEGAEPVISGSWLLEANPALSDCRGTFEVKLVGP